ncbi:MAG: hypothetical protein GY909_10055 [Oligoflexia bacterium]|nr:hypothetical protein [Oligoflexia bacterium]
MSEKNWLIRTQQKQLLGPVSKEKIIEFVEKGSLTGEDEITSGNGYWFWVKEKDLLEKYLYGDVPQTFNPISEAIDVITAHSSAAGETASFNRSPAVPIAEEMKAEAKAKAEAPAPQPAEDVEDMDDEDLDESEPQEGEDLIPSDDDLEFPDMDNINVDVPENVEVNVDFTPGENSGFLDGENPNDESNQIVDTEPDDAGDANFEGQMPSDEDLEFPDFGGEVPDLEDEGPDLEDEGPDFEMDDIPSLEMDSEPTIDDEEALASEHELAFDDSDDDDDIASELEVAAAAASEPEADPEPAQEFAAFKVDKESIDEELGDITSPGIGAPPAAAPERIDLRDTSTNPDVAPKRTSSDRTSSDRTSSDRKKRKKKKRRRRVVHTPERNDRYLVVVAFFLILIIAGVYYYYKKVLNKPLPVVGFIQSVQAQTIDTLSKKKIL